MAKLPEGRDDPRLDQLDLAEEVALAGGDLLGLGIAVPRRAALQDVAHPHVVARQPDPVQELAEQLAGRTDERHTLLVLVEARGLADEHQVGGRRAGAEHRLGAGRRERAARAARDGVAERRERGLVASSPQWPQPQLPPQQPPPEPPTTGD